MSASAAKKKKSVSIGKLFRLIEKMIKIEREDAELIRDITTATLKAVTS